MSDVFFEDLGMPKPDVHLNVGSGTHGAQTARVISAFEAYLLATVMYLSASLLIMGVGAWLEQRSRIAGQGAR